MTTEQKLQLRSSEIRQRLNELSGKETPTDAELTEIDSLTLEFRSVETRMRAVTVAGTEDPAAADTDPDPDPAADTTGEGAEFRTLAERAEVRAFLMSAAGEQPLTGAEKELVEATKAVPMVPGATVIPWECLEPRAAEVRADAITSTTGDLDPGRLHSGQFCAGCSGWESWMRWGSGWTASRLGNASMSCLPTGWIPG